MGGQSDQDEAVCRRCFGLGFRCGYVPVVADEATIGRMVSKHGNAGIDRTIFCNGNLPIDPLWHHDVCGASRTMALPQSVRGCWLLRQFQTSMGLARGMYFIAQLPI